MGSATQPSQVTSISMLSACESKNKTFLKELESLMTELIWNCSRKKMHLWKRETRGFYFQLLPQVKILCKDTKPSITETATGWPKQGSGTRTCYSQTTLISPSLLEQPLTKPAPHVAFAICKIKRTGGFVLLPNQLWPSLTSCTVFPRLWDRKILLPPLWKWEPRIGEMKLFAQIFM